MDAQWQRVTGVLEQATGRAAAIAEAHAMARQTWQAADYALDRLMDDLSTVMAVPARAHARAFVPVVVQPVDIRRRRLAA
jgi:serine protease inhibitor ecotin